MQLNVSKTIGGEEINAVCQVFYEGSREIEWLPGVKGEMLENERYLR